MGPRPFFSWSQTAIFQVFYGRLSESASRVDVIPVHFGDLTTKLFKEQESGVTLEFVFE